MDDEFITLEEARKRIEKKKNIIEEESDKDEIWKSNWKPKGIIW